MIFQVNTRLVFLRSCVAILVASALSSCGNTFWSTAEQIAQKQARQEKKTLLAETSDGEIGDKAISEDRVTEDRAPLRVEVAQAFFNQDKLTVKVRLEAKTALDASEVLIRVTGLKEGQVVEEQAQLVRDAAGVDDILAGQSLILPFSLDGKGLTEYQLRASWGEHATAFMKSHVMEPSVDLSDSNARARLAMTEKDSLAKEGAAKQSDSQISKKAVDKSFPLSLVEIDVEKQVQQCDTPPCEWLYSVKGQLYNSTPSVLEDVKLAVGLYWSEQGRLPSLPDYLDPLAEHEEVVALNGVSLQANSGKKIKIGIDQSVPQVPGGEFIPHVRVLSFTAR